MVFWLTILFCAYRAKKSAGDFDKGDRIDDDDGIVAGNDFLFLDIEDDVLGCNPVGYRIEIGDDEAQAGQQRACAFSF